MKLKSKVAIVTGSGGGRGKEIALAMAREGADVVVVDKKKEKGGEHGSATLAHGTVYQTADEIQALGRKSLPVEADVSVWKEVEEMSRETFREFGKVDILVNNSNVSVPGLLRTINVEYFDLSFRSIVVGSFHCTRAVADNMIERQCGNIIDIWGLWGDAKLSGNISYGCARAAQKRLIWALAAELKEYNIAVNGLTSDSFVGAIATAANTQRAKQAKAAGEGDYSKWRTVLLDMGERSAELLALAAVLLATETAETLTGHIITDIEVLRRYSWTRQPPLIPGASLDEVLRETEEWRRGPG